MFAALLIFSFFLLSNSYSQQNVNGWYWVNSQPQSNDLYWVQMIDANHLFAAGNNGTFMKSTDGGDSWIINSQAGVKDELFGVGSSYMLNTGWFFNASTGIVAGSSNFDDGGKIRRTTDGGLTFSSVNLGLPPGFPIVNDIYFLNSTTGYLCGNNTVKALKTTDGGLSWNSLPNLSAYNFTFSKIYADANKIIIGGYPSGKYLISLNGGSIWTLDSLTDSTNLSITDIVFQNSTTGFISGNPNYFAYTTDGGVNWNRTSFPDTSVGIYDLKIVGSNVYALGPFENYYYTSNLGSGWNQVNFDDPTNVNQPASYYVNAFDIIGNDAVIVGASGKINISNDNGSSWRNKNYAVGNSEMTFPTVFAQPGTNNLWTGSNTGIILTSTNNGSNWYKYQTSAGFNFYDIEMTNSATGYAAGGFFVAGVGYCYKTVNGGGSWSPLSLPVSTVPVNGLSFINQNTGWIFGGYAIGNDPALLYKTTDGGTSWISQALTPAGNPILVDGDMVDQNTGYCFGGNKVWKTVNGGNNWNLITNLPTDVYWNSVKVFNSSVVYVSSSNSFYKSTNGGSSWQSVSYPNNNDVVFRTDWFDQSNGTLVGTSGYTAKTKDGGITWTERNTGTSTLTGVSMSSANTVYTSSDRNIMGAVLRLNDLNTSTVLNLKIGIQGFWNGSTQVSDTVTCHLRNSSAPFNEVAIKAAVINNNGQGTFTFNSVPAGNYYLEITHRNALETWNAAPLSLSPGGNYNYDFTTSPSQAYGNNIILKAGRYCNYSGDVNHNGNIDLNDVVSVNNSTSVFTSGYKTEDITGDNFVDLSDMIITFNNASLFVAKITP